MSIPGSRALAASRRRSRGCQRGRPEERPALDARLVPPLDRTAAGATGADHRLVPPPRCRGWVRTGLPARARQAKGARCAQLRRRTPGARPFGGERRGGGALLDAPGPDRPLGPREARPTIPRRDPGAARVVGELRRKLANPFVALGV